MPAQAIRLNLKLVPQPSGWANMAQWQRAKAFVD